MTEECRAARSLWEDHQAMGRCALTGRGVPWHGCEPLRFSERPRKWQSRSEEHTSELQSLMRISYAVFCLKKKKPQKKQKKYTMTTKTKLQYVMSTITQQDTHEENT